MSKNYVVKTYCRLCHKFLQIVECASKDLSHLIKEYIYCPHCFEEQLETVKAEYNKEKELFSEYERKKFSSSGESLDMKNLKKSVYHYKKMEQQLCSYYQNLQRKERLGTSVLQKQASKEDRLEEKTELYLKGAHSFSREFMEFSFDKNNLNLGRMTATEELDILNSVNVLNEFFHIWFDGHFGTINGYRVGTISTIKVDFDEINCGLGYMILLLQSMEYALEEMKFKAIRLRCRGSTSEICSLHSGGSKSKGNVFPFYLTKKNRKSFNKAMLLFISGVNQIAGFIKSKEESFSMPYILKGDKWFNDQGEGFSFKVFPNSDKQWTRSMKYLLTNLKAQLVYISSLKPSFR